MNKIEIKDLHFSYNEGEEILKGLNLEIDERSTAIIGQVERLDLTDKTYQNLQLPLWQKILG